jgi:DNA-binding transcriptional LysR family regulator
MREDPDWDGYRSFLAVLETGSLSAAGRALGLSQPTVGRHVDQLERVLSLKLFTRSSDGLAPTEAARQLRPHAAAMAGNAAAARRVASGQGGEGRAARGIVRVSASEVIAVEVLPSILTALRRAHPELVVELVASNAMDDLLHREADIAVRMARPTQGALLARRVGGIELGFHAHADYLARHGSVRRLADLAGHSLIGFDRDFPFIRTLQARYPFLAGLDFAFRSDSDLAQLAALRSGFGIGACQVPLAARDAKLVRVLPRQFAPRLETWVAMHSDLRRTPRCDVTFQALVAGLEAYLGRR